MYKLLLAIVLFSFSLTVKAQTAEDIFTKYVDFNDLAARGQIQNAIKLGEEITANADKLPEKTRAKFTFLLASLYENNKQNDQALSCYDKVIALVPNYFVAQRAAGYLHVKKLNQIGTQLNAAKTNINENKRLTALYNAEVKKTLPYLEKAQACDPTEDTLSLIKMLYKNIKDEQGLKSLDSRLAGLSKDCQDLITD